MDGRLDEATASLMLDTRPSKVISNELIVSRLQYKLHKSSLIHLKSKTLIEILLLSSFLDK